jgi:hypothetical protein
VVAVMGCGGGDGGRGQPGLANQALSLYSLYSLQLKPSASFISHIFLPPFSRPLIKERRENNKKSDVGVFFLEAKRIFVGRWFRWPLVPAVRRCGNNG